MPPKRKPRKKKSTTLKQKQTQRQSVTVNIGSKPRAKKTSGRGGLPPPSYSHNLAPSFITNQQIDYTPLISSILHATNKIGDPQSIASRTPINNPVTPLSSTATAQQMAGERAEERRAGPTAGNLQPPPSQVRMEAEVVSPTTAQVATPISESRLSQPGDPYYRETLSPDKASGGGGGKSKRKPRATKAEMERRAEQLEEPDPRQSTIDKFLQSKPKK